MSEQQKYESPSYRIERLLEAIKGKRSIKGLRSATASILGAKPSDLKDFGARIGNHRWKGIIYETRNSLMGTIISFFDNKKYVVRGYPRIKYSDDSKVYLKECIAQEKIDGCYDSETEVLTQEGWKYWPEVTQKDIFFSRNPQGSIFLEKALLLVKIPYSGKLLHFKMKNLDLLVTPDHWNFVSLLDWKEKKAKIPIRLQAKEMKNRQCLFYADGIWNGKEEETIQIGSRILQMDDWLNFFGMWSTDGTKSLGYSKERLKHGYQVTISQRKNDLSDLFPIIERMYPEATRYFNKSNRCWIISICNKELWTYLDRFGKKGQRFIPLELKSLSKRQLIILFYSLLRGDGSKREKYIRFWTCSERMRDDFQELALKVGYSASFIGRRKNSILNGRMIKATRDTFTLNVRIKNSRPLWLPHLNGKFGTRNLLEENYEGHVYCAIVPHHTLYIRRKGIPIWSGNTNLGIFRLPDGTIMGKTRMTPNWNGTSWNHKGETWKQCFMRVDGGKLYYKIEKCLEDNDYVIYGELYGKDNPGDFIKYSIDIDFKVFDIIDRRQQRFLRPQRVKEICEQYSLPCVQEKWNGTLTDKEIQRIEFELQTEVKDDGIEGWVAKTFIEEENDAYFCKLKCDNIKEKCWGEHKPKIPYGIINKAIRKTMENFPEAITIETMEPYVLDELREDVEEPLIQEHIDKIRERIREVLAPSEDDVYKIVKEHMIAMKERGIDLRNKGHVLSNLATALGEIKGGLVYRLYQQGLRELG